VGFTALPCAGGIFFLLHRLRRRKASGKEGEGEIEWGMKESGTYEA